MIKIIKSEAFKYLFFGVLATVVYAIFMYVSFLLLENTSLAGSVSEIVGQSAAIIFAFFTNKIWVFKHKSEHLFRDFLTFTAGRLIFMAIGILLKWLFIDMYPDFLMNLFSMSEKSLLISLSLFIQILTIVLNYIYSKFIVFKSKK